MPRQKFDLSQLPPAPDLHFETALWRSGLRWVAGVDEAGRGALAGPVAAGCAVFPSGLNLAEAGLIGLRDSKEMQADSREKFAVRVKAAAAAWAVGFASAAEIDQLGIVPATRLAIRRALLNLEPLPDHLLVDALALPDVPIPQTTLIKGDARSLSIAAGAVLAKTSRDAWMNSLASQYPAYGFLQNKGYGVAAHLDALARFGPCPEHRFTFARVGS